MLMNDHHSDSGTSERIYKILSHPTRRVLLHVLRGIETPTTIETVANEVAQTEKTRQLEVALHHSHLPKMADAGVIDYDPETGTIRTNDTIDKVYSVLDIVSDERDF